MNNLDQNIKKACQRVAPAWPLKNMVAVNPYLGFSDTPFEEAAAAFMERGNVKLTMPIGFYANEIEQGKITKEDVIRAHKNLEKNIDSFNGFVKKIKRLSGHEERLEWKGSSLIDIASQVSNKDWTAFMIDSVSVWAATYFDEGISLWNSENEKTGLFASWKAHAQTDYSPQIMGLKGFKKFVKNLPNNPHEVVTHFSKEVRIETEHTEAYLHALLLKIIGWSSYVSGVDFNNNIYSGKTNNLVDFMAILLAWELYFYNEYDPKVRSEWFEKMHFKDSLNEELLEITETSVLLQEAYDIATQRELIDSFRNHHPNKSAKSRRAQMAFCIDVRSEVFRRNLETVDDSIETIGFAGFFGIPVKFKSIGYEVDKNQCPVLLPSSIEVKESYNQEKKAETKRISSHQVRKVWKKFKSGAINSFGFVSPLGLSFLPKIISDSLGWTRPMVNPKTDGLDKMKSNGLMLDLSGVSLEEKVALAAGALTGMGIKDDLAPFVLITGHGSTSVNNPHASGLECGACGGNSGEINALTTQLILNDVEVRVALKKKGIDIPETTVFVGCLHDTTTDEISIVNENLISEPKRTELKTIFRSINTASANTRMERSNRLNIASIADEKVKDAFITRSKDWSQVRPEWGLAGCNAFIVANRNKTSGLDLGGKAFLHNYNFRNDKNFELLEAIITAPMVVTSWINLQYYASTTDNKHFGAGNKTLHNVTSGSGVIEGSGGDLRIGLPLQSVHNGERFEHQPQKLNVVIEAPIEAINQILVKHKNIQNLFDNSWIKLQRLDSEGNISHVYKKNLEWEKAEHAMAPSEEKILTF